MKKLFGWLIALILTVYAILQITLLSRVIDPAEKTAENLGASLIAFLIVWWIYYHATKDSKKVSPKNSWKIRTIIAIIIINFFLGKIESTASKALMIEYYYTTVTYVALAFLMYCFNVYLAWNLDRKDVGDGRTYFFRFITLLHIATLISLTIYGFYWAATTGTTISHEYTSLFSVYDSNSQRLAEKVNLINELYEQEDWQKYYNEAVIAIDLYDQYKDSNQKLSDFLSKNKNDLLDMGLDVQGYSKIISDELQAAEKQINTLKNNVALYSSASKEEKQAEIGAETPISQYSSLLDIPNIHKRETGIITQVVDGDTYTVKTEYGTIVKVRLLGIDFPDVDIGRIKYWTGRGWTQMHVKACYSEGNEIIRSDLVTQQVILWSDDMEDEKDAYGRILRYVTLADDPYPINAYLVNEGWAVMSDWGQRVCSLCDWLLSLEQEAEKNNKGCLWTG